MLEEASTAHQRMQHELMIAVATEKSNLSQSLGLIHCVVYFEISQDHAAETGSLLRVCPITETSPLC